MPRYLTVLEIVEKADAVLSGPEVWHQGSSFADKDGNPIMSVAESAKCCIFGAVSKATYFQPTREKDINTVTSLFDRAAHRRGYRNTVNLNDTSDFPTVKALLREVIEELTT